MPTFDTPEDAVRAYLYMYEYTKNLANLYETPSDILPDFKPNRDAVKKIFLAVARSRPLDPHASTRRSRCSRPTTSAR